MPCRERQGEAVVISNTLTIVSAHEIQMLQSISPNLGQTWHLSKTVNVCRPWQWLETLKTDFQIIFERDPSASNKFEVLCCYPGFHALILHRFAHWLHQKKIAFIPRFVSYLGRFLTGIEIHPGASIGQGFFIDHGMGVVIGETAIIGDYCLIYQNVTLGGTGKEGGKRHPTLGNHVVVGTGAKILGNIQIGDHVRIGASSVVLRDVPSDCTVVGVPGRIISRNGHGCPLEHGKLPDIEAKVMRLLLDRLEKLESLLKKQQDHI